MSDYYSDPRVNWSSLKHMTESPLVYKHRLENEREDTPAFAMGRLTHTLVFEPEKFGREYAIWSEGDRRGNAWKDFQAENAGKTIFKPNEIEQAVAMADAVKRHPLVRPYLDGGLFEHVIRWTDPETRIECKARPDWLLPDQQILLDLKSTRSIDARRFGGDVARYAYYAQLGHYHNGVIHALGWKPRRTLIVAVEKDAPHDVGVFEITQDDLILGKEEVRALLERLQECRASNTWPGRYTSEQVLELPGYIHGEVEFEYE
jgi:hypothetical protein